MFMMANGLNLWLSSNLTFESVCEDLRASRSFSSKLSLVINAVSETLNFSGLHHLLRRVGH